MKDNCMQNMPFFFISFSVILEIFFKILINLLLFRIFSEISLKKELFMDLKVFVSNRIKPTILFAIFSYHFSVKEETLSFL